MENRDFAQIRSIGNTRQRRHFPKKYLDPETSGPSVTIDGPTDSFLIEITRGGGQPFIENLQ